MRAVAQNLFRSACLALSLAGAGCWTGRPQPIEVSPLAVKPSPTSAPATQSETPHFNDLATVLTAAVNEDGYVDATALAANLPTLERQLALLAQPWPAEALTKHSDERLAWLYNARAAWSLRIVARELRPLAGRGDSFDLPATIGQRRLLDSPFPLAGGRSTLRQIDEELASYDDFRLAVAAPGASDMFGPLPTKPFTAETVRSSLAERFRKTALDGQRWVIDHDARQLQVPPVLWRFAQRVKDEYDRRYRTAGAELGTALLPLLDAEGRWRLNQARGYSVQQRTGPAGIAVQRLTEPQRRKVFGY